MDDLKDRDNFKEESDNLENGDNYKNHLDIIWRLS